MRDDQHISFFMFINSFPRRSASPFGTARIWRACRRAERFMKAAHAMHGGKLFPERQSREAAEDKMLQRWIAYLVCFLEQGRGMFLRAFRKLIDRAVLSPGQPVGQPLPETDPVQLFSIR